MATGKHVAMAISRFAVLLFAGVIVGLAHADWPVWTPNGETQFVGRATDATTGEPIANASIIATYVLSAGSFHQGPGCSVAEYARANERGEYVLPFYEGLPPQFLNTFGHRYVAPWRSPRAVTKDDAGWIVVTRQIVGKQARELSREGPFKTEELATKASRLLQDVWLEKFEGSDEEWLQKLNHMPIHAGPGCASGKSGGIVEWQEALLREAESMPDSRAKDAAVHQLTEELAYVRKHASKTVRSHLPKR